MPGGNRRGPAGDGPETGRGAGWCHSGDQPGYETAPGRGAGYQIRVRQYGQRQIHRDSSEQNPNQPISDQPGSGTPKTPLILIEKLKKIITLLERLDSEVNLKEETL